MKKWLAFLLSVILSVSFVGIGKRVNAATGFSDLTGSEWFSAHLSVMLEKTIVNGFPDGTFRPAATVNADQFMKMVVVAMGITPRSFDYAYWAQPYLFEASVRGYDRGLNYSESDWKKPISRYHMAVVIANVLGDDTLPRNYGLVQTVIPDYAVVEAKSNPLAVMACYTWGIITGYTDGSFKPDNTMTRSEAIAVIHRLMDPAVRTTTAAVRQVLETDTVVVDGFEFSYENDTVESNFIVDMNEEAFVRYFTSTLDDLRFYTASDGSLHVKGYLPELPVGFFWLYSINIIRTEAYAQEHGIMEIFNIEPGLSGPNHLPSSGAFDKTLNTPDPSLIRYIDLDVRIYSDPSQTYHVLGSLVTTTEIPLCYYDHGSDRIEIPYDWRQIFEW